MFLTAFLQEVEHFLRVVLSGCRLGGAASVFQRRHRTAVLFMSEALPLAPVGVFEQRHDEGQRAVHRVHR